MTFSLEKALALLTSPALWSSRILKQLCVAHMQVIGDYFVIVFTELDSQGNEVITSCERGVQNAYEPAKKKVWSDINGTIYQEMLINKERTRATIIYKEDGVDKEFVIEIPN